MSGSYVVIYKLQSVIDVSNVTFVTEQINKQTSKQTTKQTNSDSIFKLSKISEGGNQVRIKHPDLF